MKSRRRSIIKLRTAIALALALWCAGVGCMLVSYAHGAAMNQMSDGQSGKQSFAGLSASMGHDCCKARHSSSKRNAGVATNQMGLRPESSTGVEEIALPISPGPSGAMSCCPLTSGSFVVASRARTHETNHSTLTPGGDVLLSLAKSSAAPLAPPLRLPNQDQTYLRCCVFLI